MAVIREWTGEGAPGCTAAADELKTRIQTILPHDNVLRLHVEYRKGGIDADHDVHDEYLKKLRESILDRLQQLVNASVEADPEIKSRKKMVQEVYAESMAHFALLRELPLIDENDEVVERIKRLMLAGKCLILLDLMTPLSIVSECIKKLRVGSCSTFKKKYSSFKWRWRMHQVLSLSLSLL